ncbi:hypothetical protein [Soonwooa sp.]|uniref:hypothetical protein n=1 Tax=Soonwooa sp. TaxID=1938592 RepID=UPI0026116030|nr:hypothetical protein [Soonwooa sp.]
MRNWHHKVIKSKLSFLFLFLCLFGFGQKKIEYDASFCEDAYKKDSILYLKFRKEARHVNYKKLTEKIINDIQWDSLKKPNLIFTFIPQTAPSPMDYEPSQVCDFYYKTDKPNYNDTIFWSKNNINFIIKKYKKNVIPRVISSFIDDERTFSNIIGYKSYIKQIKRQKEGVYKDSWDNRKFYYFPYNKKEKLILNGRDENYDELTLSFLNELGNIVIVEFEYGNTGRLSFYRRSIQKKYQYINKEWIELKKEV